MQPDIDGPKIRSSNDFLVVGIGASAGGLAAFKKLLQAIPVDSGMAYVLVQHLDPNHESLLPALLQKATAIPVKEISDDIRVEPNHIYIIPSNKMLVANDGVLQLSPRPKKGKTVLHLPIDLFFISLAEVHGAYAIGVVLSGTASDGTAGLKAIKDHGGITFAQDEASAEYDGMPQSAARAGVVDFILPPEDIPARLMELKQQIDLSDDELQSLPKMEEDLLREIIFLLRLRKGSDFSYYKRPTIRRRIYRRMALAQTETLVTYLKYLRESTEELDALYQDLLIPVTSFFRDYKVFNTLCETVFPNIIKIKETDGKIRVWVAGCSTGQEAYSIAICLKEFLGDTGMAQIIATDLNETAIVKARLGVYSESEMEGVSPTRMLEFFAKTDAGYKVQKEIRDMCVFAVHSFLKDPPFGKIDLVSCRNVLIYLEPYLQRKALTTFHYSLVQKGFLLLGKAETCGSMPELFETTGGTDKLFNRKDAPGKYMHVASQRSERNLHELNAVPNSRNLHTDFQKTADEIILGNYAPAGVIINEAMEIVQFRGDTSNYLTQGSGKPSHNLMKMAKGALAFELRSIIHKARKENLAASKDAVHGQTAGRAYTVKIEAIPLPNIVEPHWLILFHETSFIKARVRKATSTNGHDERDLRILQLEKEHAQVREDMHSITEEQQANNEELQSTNEELLSGSEELQSLNEELETSKEELQSSNEELTVLNQELTSLNEQLHEALTDQEVSRTKLEIQTRMTQNLLMTAPGFICTMRGPEHVYEMVNDRYQRLFGKRKLKGKPMLEALPELVGQGIDTLLDNVYNTGETYVGIEVPMTLARDEGLEPEIGHFNFSYQPMYDEKGTISAILVFGYEVTAEVMAKSKIMAVHEAHAKELEQLVAERTQELRGAVEELKQMNKELVSFTYISSHDLQEPLRKIQTFSSRIISTDLDALSEGGKESFARINNAASRMQILIKDLLVYSQTNIAERQFEQTELGALVQEVIAEHADAIGDVKAIIEVGDLCPVRINPFQFRQVLHNLISNSLKFFRPEVIPQITISCSTSAGEILQKQRPNAGLGSLAPDKRYSHFVYSDNGIGFEPLYNERIFEIFQRLHDRSQYSGTGIGLAIVKKIVEHHYGVITASGTPGEGAKFDIYIPAE